MNRLALFLLFLFFFFPATVFAQGLPSSPPRPEEEQPPILLPLPGAPKEPEVPKLPEEEGGVKVTSIEVTGNKEIVVDRIMEVLTVKEGELLTQSKLRQNMQAIFDLGYFTDVKASSEPHGDGSKIIFQVIENPKVEEVDISGNSLVSNDKIRDLIRTEEGEILNTRILYDDVLAINEYYESLGYTDPANHVTELRWKKPGTVVMRITEATIIKDVTFKGNTVFSTSALKKLVKVSPGDPFNKKKLEEDMSRIAEKYKVTDYVLEGLRGNINPDGVVSIELTEATVEDLRFDGLKKTKEVILRKIVRTKPGEVLHLKKVRKDVQRLNNSGFFESVNVAPEEGAEPGKVVLVFKVKEQKTGSATFGLGFSGGGGSSKGGLTGSVAVSERNIAGRGRSGYLQWQRGVLIDSLSIGFLDPYVEIGKEETSIGFTFFNTNLFQQRQALPGTNPVQFALFKDRRSGATFTIGKPLTEETRVFLTLKHEKIDTTPDPTPEFPLIATNLAKGSINSGTVTGVHDERDDVFDPHTGMYGLGAFELAGGIFGGNFGYNKYQGEFRKYFPIEVSDIGFLKGMFKGTHTLAFRLLGGGSGGNLPITEMYVLGGADTLRGYTLNRFIGNRMFMMTAEYRFPIAGSKIFSGAVFGDVGKAYAPGEKFSFSNIAKDYGVGVRVNLPNLGLGVIRLDFAFGDEGSRSVIGIGQSF